MNERMNERTQGRPLPSREGKPSSPPTTVCLPGWEEPGGGPVKGTAAPPPSLQAPQLVGGCPGLQGGFFCPGGQSRVCPDPGQDNDPRLPASAPWTPPRRAPAPFPPPRPPSPVRRQRWRGGVGGGAERRGGLLAGVQRVELSPLAPSFASGQEAELRWKGRRQRQGQPLSPLVPGPLPHLLAPACASAPQLAEPRPDSQAPQISDPPTPGFAPFPALPLPSPAMAGRFPSRCRARARPWPPRGNPGRSAQTPH